MSDTILVAIITACATTIPQIITALINKNKELNLKKYENYNQNRLNTIIEFLDSVGSIYTNGGISQVEKTKFDKSLNKLLLYFPDIDNKMTANIYNSLSQWDVSKRQEAIQPLIKQLSKSISEK